MTCFQPGDHVAASAIVRVQADRGRPHLRALAQRLADAEPVWEGE